MKGDQSMQLNAKRIAERLNQSLDDMGVPINTKERTSILSKMLDIPRQQAWNLLEGHMLPSELLLDKIASEFEMDLNLLRDET